MVNEKQCNQGEDFQSVERSHSKQWKPDKAVTRRGSTTGKETCIKEYNSCERHQPNPLRQGWRVMVRGGAPGVNTLLEISGPSSKRHQRKSCVVFASGCVSLQWTQFGVYIGGGSQPSSELVKEGSMLEVIVGQPFQIVHLCV